jgi:hypothetical protein
LPQQVAVLLRVGRGEDDAIDLPFEQHLELPSFLRRSSPRLQSNRP